MLMCTICGKSSQQISYSRHKRGHGILGVWRLRAQITKRTQTPNLHSFKNKRYCTKCLRMVKAIWNAERLSKPTQPAAVV